MYERGWGRYQGEYRTHAQDNTHAHRWFFPLLRWRQREYRKTYMNYENLSMITITDTNVSITHTFPPLHWYINDRKHINIYEDLSMITITDTNITFTHTFPFPFYWILLSEIDRNHVWTWMRTLSRRVYTRSHALLSLMSLLHIPFLPYIGTSMIENI